MARTDADIIGRDDVNDLDAILAITNTEKDEVIHTVQDNADALFKPFFEPFVKQADAMAVRKGDIDSLNFLNNWIMLRTLDGWLEERQTYWFKNREWRDNVAPAR